MTSGQVVAKTFVGKCQAFGSKFHFCYQQAIGTAGCVPKNVEF
jgi:hypothetical protein